ARNIHIVRQVVVAGRKYELLRGVYVRDVEAIACVYTEVPIASLHAFYALILPDVQRIVVGNFAIVLQRLAPIWFLVRTAEWNVADFKKLRRGEERHVGRIVKQGVHQAAFVDQNRAQSHALRVNRASHPRRTCSDYQYIEDFRAL